VLRRELRLAEGELYTTPKLIRSRQRLVNLGFFDEVSVSTTPGSAPDKVVINIEVKERPTGVFSVGAGYSSQDKLVGILEVSQRNLFGLGQELFLRTRLGSRNSLVNLGFTEPYFLNRPIAAGFDIFNTTRIYDDFSRKSVGGDLRASYPLTEFTRGFATYKFERTKVSDVSEDATSALRDEAGTTATSSVLVSVVTDSRDNIFEPTRGSRHALSAEVAGLGGDSRFVKSVASTTWFFPLPADFVLGLNAEAGVASGFAGRRVPVFERFFLGGANTIRGLRARSLSPRDDTGARIGGTSMIFGNVEVGYPVIRNVRVAVFFDAGDVYGSGKEFDLGDIRTAAGLGFRWFSPIGPIRLDWGYNLDPKDGEKRSQFHFSVGGPF
jgi:outer membrane protein insertion porin family